MHPLADSTADSPADSSATHRPPTRAWLALLVLAAISLLAATDGHGWLPWMGWMVAALAWFKAQLVAAHYLELHRATPIVRRCVQAFIAAAPLALAVTAWLER